ncbi:MAG: ornithine aminotransferase [Micavibrio sp.]|nr:ornithine aminotransferase [Micavibrio sp.]
MPQDAQLQREVVAELNWEPSVTAAHIGVVANAGIITLSGHVESYSEKYAAEQATYRVKGVLGVAEEIQVQLPFERQRGDEDIATAAIERLSWDTFVPPDAVKVKVEDGYVTLTGEVNLRYQKDAAEEDVRRLFGVIGISNQITVTPRTNIANIKSDIMHALHRSWFSDPKKIIVSAEGGEVRLTGNVHTPQDKLMAATMAWSAPGVTNVANDIKIT